MCVFSPKLTAGENARAQSPATGHKIFGAAPNRIIHPVARRTMLAAVKADTLDFELASDEGIEVDTFNDNVPADR